MTRGRFNTPESLQRGLPGLDDNGGERHRLFLALFPDTAARAEIARVAQTVRARFALPRMISADRYHVTLHFLGDNSQLRADQVVAAQQAAQHSAGAPFALAFTGLANFGARHNPACVLRASQVPPAAQALWQDLHDRLVRVGLGKDLAQTFTPHMTLAYTRRVQVADADIEPNMLQATEFVLIHSILGKSIYRTLGRWPLSGG